MDTAEAIRGRRSVRRFTDRPLTAAETDSLAEALLWAPSAGNLQSRRFYFVLDHDARMRVAVASLGQMFIALAPLVVVACADTERARKYGRRGIELYAVQDAAVAVENMMLMAHSLGLGSVWVGAFDERELSAILDLPGHLRPMAVVPVGHPAHRPTAPPRYSMDELITFIR